MTANRWSRRSDILVATVSAQECASYDPCLSKHPQQTVTPSRKRVLTPSQDPLQLDQLNKACLRHANAAGASDVPSSSYRMTGAAGRPSEAPALRFGGGREMAVRIDNATISDRPSGEVDKAALRAPPPPPPGTPHAPRSSPPLSALAP